MRLCKLKVLASYIIHLKLLPSSGILRNENKEIATVFYLAHIPSKKLKQIKLLTPSDWFFSNQDFRQEEMVMTRFRIGRTNLTHSHLIFKSIIFSAPNAIKRKKKKNRPSIHKLTTTHSLNTTFKQLTSDLPCHLFPTNIVLTTT